MRATTKQYELLFQDMVLHGIKEGTLQAKNLPIQAALFGAIVSGSISQVTRAENGQAVPVDHEEFIAGIYDTIIKIFN